MVDDPKIEERKHFMKPHFQDPLKKREEFSISLRKKKKQEIIQSKRKRAFDENQIPQKSEDQEEQENEELLQKIYSMLPPELQESDWDQKLAYILDYLLQLNFERNQSQEILQKQLLILSFIKKSANLEMECLSLVQKIPLMETLSQLYSNLLIMRGRDNDEHVLKKEITWILVNLSANDDSLVVRSILKPEFNFLRLLNESLKIPNEAITSNVIWVMSNLIGEKDPLILQQILEQTDLFQFLSMIKTWSSISYQLLNLLPWLCNNILKLKPLPSLEIIKVCLDVCYVSSIEQFKIENPKRRHKIVTDIFWALHLILNELPSSIDYIMQFNLKDMFEFALSSEKYELMRSAVKVMGQIMAGDDRICMQAYHKVPSMHRLLLDFVLPLLPPTLPIHDPSNPEELFIKNKVLVKEALWAISNIAASPSLIIDLLIEDKVHEILLRVSNVTFREVFLESMFTLLNLVTNVSKKNFHKLISRDIIVHISRLLSDKDCSSRLLTNALEALQLFLQYDEELQLQDEASIRNFFDQCGGYEALTNLNCHPNSNIAVFSERLVSHFFKTEDTDFFFSGDYQRNANDVNDDEERSYEVYEEEEEEGDENIDGEQIVNGGNTVNNRQQVNQQNLNNGNSNRFII